jgi:2-dehydro-3-deoxygluconokinase
MGHDIVAMGECLVAFVAEPGLPMRESRSFDAHVAGAEANVAIGASLLGGDAAFIGRVGDDGLGHAVIGRLRAAGVDSDHVRVDSEAPTGVFVRECRALGVSDVVYWRRGSAGSRLAAEDVEAAHHAFVETKWLHLTGITFWVSESAAAAGRRAIAIAAHHGVRLSFDLHYRQRLASHAEAKRLLEAVAPSAALVFAGEREAALMTGRSGVDAARAILEMGADRVILKGGAAGALSLGLDGPLAEVPGFPIGSPADPVGAGMHSRRDSSPAC